MFPSAFIRVHLRFVLLAIFFAAPLAAGEPRTEYMGRAIARTMHYLGAPWLTRDSREREEEPAKMLAALEIKTGQTVCDLGCGNGFYTFSLAEKVGPRGKVLAVDIQPEMLDLLRERAKARNFPNVVPVLGDVDDPHLPAGAVDLVLLVDVYHEFSHPEEMLAAIRTSLSPTGRVALVEFRAEDPAVPIKRLHKMSQRQCHKEYTANGFKLVGQFDELPWQHVLFFARDDSSLPAHELKPWK
jgi:ubiquinone/menaquinone biosynthesis C-methylase UbiE